MPSALPELAGQLALAMLAGLLLNLTPCVLPAIPVKVRTIMHHSGNAAAQRTMAALAFTAGSLAFFLGLGLITAGLHWTWGTLFQSRAVLAALIALLCLFAVVTFFDTRLPVPGFAQRLGGRHHLEAFFSGAFSALLAAPCTGPFLGGVLAFAVTKPTAEIIAIFLAVGLGLALPYVVVLARPSLLDRLPRAGAWSTRVRQALALVLLAAAAFFARALLPAGSGELILWSVWLALVVAWLVTVLVHDRAWSARGIAAGFTALAAAALFTVGPFRAGHATLNWQPLPPGGVTQITGRPALVEFTADWCINCKVLERTVYSEASVAHAAQRADLATFKVDLTQPNHRLDKLLVSYGGAGIPFAVVLNPHGHVVKRFPGLFSATDLLHAIRQASGGQT